VSLRVVSWAIAAQCSRMWLSTYECAIEDSLPSGLGTAGGSDLLQEKAEQALDLFLEDGFAKETPIIGTVAK
jgi:hypothetical protein